MSESDNHAPGPDPLTTGLPGLPIEFRNVCIDETGFHRAATRRRPEAHFTWEQVTAVRSGLFAVVVEGRREPNGRVRTLARSWAPKAKIKSAVDAWKEYGLRTLEQRGTIRGSCDVPLLRCAYRVLIGAGLFMALIGALSMYLWATVLDGLAPTGTGFRGAVAVEPIEMESVPDEDGLPPSGFRGIPMGSAWATESEADDDGLSPSATVLAWKAVYGFQYTVGLGLVLMALMQSRAMRRWSRWEFIKEGFAFGPDGKRQTLGPPQKITMGLWRFTHLRVGRERNMPVQAASVAWLLFLALNEHLGGSARWRLAWDLTVAFAASAAFWALVIWDPTNGGSPGELTLGFLVAPFLTFVLFAMPILLRREQKRCFAEAIAEGREMLKRLGW